MPGPAPMSRCAACRPSRRLEVDAGLRAGKTHASIAAATGISRHVVSRHARAGHVAPPPSGEPEAPRPPRERPGADATPAELLRDALNALNDMDPASLSASAQIARIDALRRTADGLAKIEPAAPPSTVHWRDIPEIGKLIGVLARNLEAVQCSECGHHNGPALRAKIANHMKEEGI